MRSESLAWRLYQYQPRLARRLCFTQLALRALLAGHDKTTGNAAIRTMGLPFSGPVGLAAGFDRYGLLAKHWHRLGFSHVELGTLTRHPEPGFNRGIDSLRTIRRQPREHGIIGINIGINRHTPAEQAEQDLLYCQRRGWHLADYFCLNLANRNALTLLQDQTRLGQLLENLSHNGHNLTNTSGHRVPLVIKLSLRPEQNILPDIISELGRLGVAGLLLAFDPGPPASAKKLLSWQDPALQMQVCATIRHCRQLLDQQVSLLTVGGAYQPEHIQQRLNAGAGLVQVHNGLLLNASPLLREIAALRQKEPTKQI